MEIMYHMFYGSSADGRGHARYVGRTTVKAIAQAHLDKIKKDPYSFGDVVWYDEKTEYHASSTSLGLNR